MERNCIRLILSISTADYPAYEYVLSMARAYLASQHSRRHVRSRSFISTGPAGTGPTGRRHGRSRSFVSTGPAGTGPTGRRHGRSRSFISTGPAHAGPCGRNKRPRAPVTSHNRPTVVPTVKTNCRSQYSGCPLANPAIVYSPFTPVMADLTEDSLSLTSNTCTSMPSKSLCVDASVTPPLTSPPTCNSSSMFSVRRRARPARASAARRSPAAQPAWWTFGHE